MRVCVCVCVFVRVLLCASRGALAIVLLWACHCTCEDFFRRFRSCLRASVCAQVFTTWLGFFLGFPHFALISLSITVPELRELMLNLEKLVESGSNDLQWGLRTSLWDTGTRLGVCVRECVMYKCVVCGSVHARVDFSMISKYWYQYPISSLSQAHRVSVFSPVGMCCACFFALVIAI